MNCFFWWKNLVTMAPLPAPGQWPPMAGGAQCPFPRPSWSGWWHSPCLTQNPRPPPSAWREDNSLAIISADTLCPRLSTMIIEVAHSFVSSFKSFVRRWTTFGNHLTSSSTSSGDGSGKIQMVCPCTAFFQFEASQSLAFDALGWLNGDPAISSGATTYYNPLNHLRSRWWRL